MAFIETPDIEQTPAVDQIIDPQMGMMAGQDFTLIIALCWGISFIILGGLTFRAFLAQRKAAKNLEALNGK